MPSDEQLELFRLVRAAYVDAGAKRGPICASETCLFLAVMKVYWPVLPGEEYPVYCQRCGEWALKVLETLGIRASSEMFPVPPVPGVTRHIELSEE